MRRVRLADVDSPFGPLLVAVTPSGIARLAFTEERRTAVDELGDGAVLVDDPRGLSPIARQLEEYFAGRRTAFDVPIDLDGIRGFARRVLEVTARIPYGTAATYGDVAARAGSPRAGRAAGNALNRNPVPIVVPCHRVVPADGGIGGYGGHEDRKAFLLRLEGSL